MARQVAAATRGPQVIAITCGTLAVLGLIWTVATRPTEALTGHVYEDAATAVVWSLLTWLVCRHSRNPIRHLFQVIAACSSLAVIGGVAGAQDWYGAVGAAWIASWIWVVSSFAPITVLPAAFPAGRLAQRPVLSVLSMIGLAVMAAGAATEPHIGITSESSVPNPLASSLSDALFLAGSVVIAITSVMVIVVLWRQTRRATQSERRQTVPVALAVTITLPGLLAADALAQWAPLMQLALAPLVPASIAVSILRFHLYDIEVVVRRSLVFLGLTMLVVGGYVVVVQAVSHLTPLPADGAASIVATAVIALAFTPARVMLQRIVGRWVYGERDAPARAMAEIGGLVSDTPDAERALGSATARLREALRVPWVQVRADGDMLAECGTRPRWVSDQALDVFPLMHLGSVQGEVRIAPRAPRESLGPRDSELLAPLLPLMAAVIGGGKHVAELRRSSERAVMAREEERRRVRRDLHDGIGPLLSAIATHADVAMLRLRRDPVEAADVIERIHELSDDAVAGLRRVVDDLAPVAFDEVDLTTALEQLTGTLSATGPRIQMIGSAGLNLPAAVEVAMYRIVAEAISNALRHARANTIMVSLERSTTALVVEVRDDGRGIPSVVVPGVGLASMRERATELGARFTSSSSSAGTTVHAEFPLGAV
jgi:signal transduction histidine kinase